MGKKLEHRDHQDWSMDRTSESRGRVRLPLPISPQRGQLARSSSHFLSAIGKALASARTGDKADSFFVCQVNSGEGPIQDHFIRFFTCPRRPKST